MKLEIIRTISEEKSQKPPLLFIHGAYHAAWCWEENFLTYFSDHGYPCYALSLRGHGNSEGHSNIKSYRLKDYIDDVLTVIEKIKTKPILIGHSMGGAIAQVIANSYEHKISGLVLLASVPPKGMLESFCNNLFNEYQSFKKILNIEKKNNRYESGKLFFSEYLCKKNMYKYCQKLQKESKIASIQLLKRLIKKRSETSIKIPLLIIGAKNDKMITEKQTYSMGRYYGKEILLLEKSGHDIMLDVEWEKSAKFILNFLENYYV